MSPKKTKVKVNLTRGDVLKVVGAAAGSVVAAQVLTTGTLSPFAGLKQGLLEDSEASGEHLPGTGHHWGMVINMDACIGCEYCVRACTAVNDVATDKTWNIVVEEKSTSGHTFYFSRPCLHCQHAPCVEVCPVKATYHREDGLVIMDYDRCIGCRYCQVACPYDARKFNWEARSDINPYVPTFGAPEVERRPRGVVEKCTFCVHRIDTALNSGLIPGEAPGTGPACVDICPVGARVFGDLNNPESIVSRMIAQNATIRLREELGADPSVYYIPPKEGL